MTSFERIDDDLVDRYLERIGLASRPAVDLDGLSELMLGHLLHVSFDNLDVFDQRGVTTEPVDNITKIVDRRRGGWCFELNSAFGRFNVISSALPRRSNRMSSPARLMISTGRGQ